MFGALPFGVGYFGQATANLGRPFPETMIETSVTYEGPTRTVTSGQSTRRVTYDGPRRTVTFDG